MKARRALVDRGERPSLSRQCALLGLGRSTYYYEPAQESAQNLGLMRRLDELHLAHPVYGSRRLTHLLRQEGREVNRKRVARLLRVMGVEAIYPRRRTSRPGGPSPLPLSAGGTGDERPRSGVGQ